MPETGFSVRFDGPEVMMGRIPATKIGASLLALGDMFTIAQPIVGPEFGPVVLKVDAVDHGSFIVRLILESDSGLWDQAVRTLNSESVSAIVNFAELVTFGTGSYFGLMKLFKGQVPKPVAQPGDTVTVPAPNGELIELPVEAYKLLLSQPVRREAERVVEPLNAQGIDRIVMESGLDDDVPPVEIRKDDVKVFAAAEPEPEPEPEDFVRVEKSFTVVAPSFDGKKWRLSDGARSIWAQIEDENFNEGVDGGDRFGKGDVLIAKVRIIENPDDHKRPECVIEEVIEFFPNPAAEQLELHSDHGAVRLRRPSDEDGDDSEPRQLDSGEGE